MTIFIITVLYIYLLYKRYIYTPLFNKNINWVHIFSETTLLWFSIYSALNGILTIHESDYVGFIFLFSGIPLFAMFFKIFYKKKESLKVCEGLNNFKEDTDVEQYLNILFDLIKKKDS